MWLPTLRGREVSGSLAVGGAPVGVGREVLTVRCQSSRRRWSWQSPELCGTTVGTAQSGRGPSSTSSRHLADGTRHRPTPRSPSSHRQRFATCCGLSSVGGHRATAPRLDGVRLQPGLIRRASAHQVRGRRWEGKPGAGCTLVGPAQGAAGHSSKISGRRSVPLGRPGRGSGDLRPPHSLGRPIGWEWSTLLLIPRGGGWAFCGRCGVGPLLHPAAGQLGPSNAEQPQARTTRPGLRAAQRA